MSKMKGIAENLLEVVAYYPNMTADYDVEFFPCDFKVYEIRENGKYQSEISDLGFIHVILSRSEERRVGKECRSRWSPYH